MQILYKRKKKHFDKNLTLKHTEMSINILVMENFSLEFLKNYNFSIETTFL